MPIVHPQWGFTEPTWLQAVGSPYYVFPLTDDGSAWRTTCSGTVPQEDIGIITNESKWQPGGVTATWQDTGLTAPYGIGTAKWDDNGGQHSLQAYNLNYDVNAATFIMWCSPQEQSNLNAVSYQTAFFQIPGGAGTRLIVYYQRAGAPDGFGNYNEKGWFVEIDNSPITYMANAQIPIAVGDVEMVAVTQTYSSPNTTTKLYNFYPGGVRTNTDTRDINGAGAKGGMLTANATTCAADLREHNFGNNVISGATHGAMNFAGFTFILNEELSQSKLQTLYNTFKDK